MMDDTREKNQFYAKREKNWPRKRLALLKGSLGERSNEIHRLAASPPSYLDSTKQSERITATINLFKELSDADQRKLWQTLFPTLAEHCQRAWQEAGARPYQLQWERTPFRAQNRTTIIETNRARFFMAICHGLRGLDGDAEWLAANAQHFDDSWHDSHAVGWLLSSILRFGGDDAEKVRHVLIESMHGDHPTGDMGRHIIVALLNSSEPSDWELIGKLLLAAQRQEGLRQSILETVDEAHPAAFRYMLGLILEHDLGRFSSAVRAFDVWLKLQWAGGSVKEVNAGVRSLCAYFDDDELCKETVKSGPAAEAYFAMWVMAYQDAEQAMAVAAELLHDADPERRYAAFRILMMVDLQPEALDHIARYVASEHEDDLRMQMVLVEYLGYLRYDDELQPPEVDMFDALARLYESAPTKARQLEPLIWPWATTKHERRMVANAMWSAVWDDPERMLPYAEALDTYACASIVRQLAGVRDGYNPFQGLFKKRKNRVFTPEVRSFMLQMEVDRRKDVHQAAFEVMSGKPIEADEVDILVANLHRTTPTFRRGALGRLVKLDPQPRLEVATKLISDRNSKKKAAGLELLHSLKSEAKLQTQIHALVQEHQETLDTDDLKTLAEKITGKQQVVVSFADALGLVPAGSRCPPIVPVFRNAQLETDAAVACLRSLADVFLDHADDEIEVDVEDAWRYTDRMALLSNAMPQMYSYPSELQSEQKRTLDALPLRAVWETWIQQRPVDLRDADGLELVRAWALCHCSGEAWTKWLPKAFRAFEAWEICYSFKSLLDWVLRLSPHPDGLALLVQLAEDRVARVIEKSQVAGSNKETQQKTKIYFTLNNYYSHIYMYTRYVDKEYHCKSSMARAGAIQALSMDLGHGDTGPGLNTFTAAYDAGLLNEYDFAWCLLKPRTKDMEVKESEQHYQDRVRFGPIEEATALRPPGVLAERPALLAMAHRVRDRLIEIELGRGEQATLATVPAERIRHAGGAEVMFRVIAALGRDKIIRQAQWGEPTKPYSLSRLLAMTTPDADDTSERFADLASGYNLKPARLLEIAMYAPQWASLIEDHLNMPGLEDAVWWIHAHTKQTDSWRNKEIRETWAAKIRSRCELEASDLEEGAVDVAWFHRVIDRLGLETWESLQNPAKYASSSGGHKRAELFASAMLGRIELSELEARLAKSRHQDSVRAVGLLPLSGKAAEAKTQTLHRYSLLQEYKRQSRQFGSQRQASEGRAVEIGMQNLARTAGYRDPWRMQWAMEAEAVADLATGPVVVTVEATSVSLSIDDAGDTVLEIRKNDKVLKSLPAALRKHEGISQLRSRVTELRRQRSRMLRSLEEAMCRGDGFSGQELAELSAHPILRSMLQRLIFIGEGELVGYPDAGGKVLRNYEGRVEPIGKRDTVRLAHPSDLFARGDWHQWQRECFAAERVQPFKQVFRELYPKTQTELAGLGDSTRYSGHQVNPRQALALLKQRQWVYSAEEGVRRVFHDEGIIAELFFEEHFYTPAEVDGLTLDRVQFFRKGKKYEKIRVNDVPERVFSEAMRDLDLVVSVAHAGGVDPEATASTIEMRSTLVRETCQLLGLTNARIKGHHVMIDGTRASYSVHLGSATTHVVPGHVLVIVAVHSQYRGRLFLPFADADPKTAEILAKVLLLARDHEIKDPSILGQIRA